MYTTIATGYRAQSKRNWHVILPWLSALLMHSALASTSIPEALGGTQAVAITQLSPSEVDAKGQSRHQSGGQSAVSLPSVQPLQVCGEARLSVLFWDVYESTLLTPGGRWQPGIRPLRLEIQYLRDIAAEDLIAQTRKEWQAQGLKSQQHEAWLDQLSMQWRDVTEGDRISLAIDEAGASAFYFNDEPLGVIADPAFGEDFSGIWLSPSTTRPALRKALIGGQ